MRKIAVLIATAALVLTPTTAFAHPFNIYQGNDYTRINDAHVKGWVRDMECDGNRVAAQINYGGWIYEVVDNNGCSSGGNEFGIGAQADKVRTCEETPYGFTKCSSYFVV